MLKKTSERGRSIPNVTVTLLVITLSLLLCLPIMAAPRVDMICVIESGGVKMQDILSDHDINGEDPFFPTLTHSPVGGEGRFDLPCEGKRFLDFVKACSGVVGRYVVLREVI